jgi:GNAT superfamily N-acetyltransferase
MVESLGEVTLKSGERVQAAAIRGPDEAWRPRLERLLGHKGDPWLWQNSTLLTHATGVEAWFYVLHRESAPLAHIMTAELGGVGIFGHVWTEPADRGQGAAAQLMERQMAHFRGRNGRALFLHTSPDSTAYRLYQRQGFMPVEPGSGAMSFTARDRAEFEAGYFAAGEARIGPLAWPHWPTAPALFLAAIPGVVRCAPLGLFGRQSPEGVLLPWIQRAQPGGGPPAGRVFVACKPNGTVVGLAASVPDPFSADCLCVDVFCHPLFWSQGSALLAAVLEDAGKRRRVAYADSDCPQKVATLAAAGFRAAAAWPRRLAANAAATRHADLIMLEQGGPRS